MKRQKQHKMNCTALVRKRLMQGRSDKRILKEVRKYNKNFKEAWINDIKERITTTTTDPSTTQCPAPHESVFGFRVHDKVLRIFPPQENLRAGVFQGEVTEILADKVICQIFITDDRHSQAMTFDKQTGMGTDETGSFIIKQVNLGSSKHLRFVNS